MSLNLRKRGILPSGLLVGCRKSQASVDVMLGKIEEKELEQGQADLKTAPPSGSNPGAEKSGRLS